MDPSQSAVDGVVPGAAEIAAALTESGRFVFVIDPLPTQRMVDAHWTAHRAGQLLGIKVRVVVESPALEPARLVTVTVTPRQDDLDTPDPGRRAASAVVPRPRPGQIAG